MKPDEKFAITHLEKHLKLESSRFFDGNDPPDCFGLFPLQRIGVEITRIGAVHIETDGKTVTKRDFDRPIQAWTVKAPKELAPLVPPNFTLFCHVKGPIDDFSKFKKTFSKTIENLIATDQIKVETKEFKIGSAAVDLALRPRNNPPLSVIITSGVVEHNLPLQFNLEIQTDASVDIALQDKHQKCSKCKERIWLLLINTHPIIDESHFKRINKDIFKGTFFERVYIVDPSGQVLLLFEKRPSLPRYLTSFIGWCYEKTCSIIDRKRDQNQKP